MNGAPILISGISFRHVSHYAMLLLFLFMFQSDTLAQLTDKPVLSRVYLENKSVFYGEILSWDEDGVMELQTKNGITLTIPSHAIKKVVQQKPKTSPNDFIRPQGWYGGGALGIGFNDVSGMVLADIYGGFVRHRMLHIGLMTGLHRHYFSWDEQFLPVQLEWRGYWSKQSFSPYTVARLGTSFGFFNEVRNDWNWEARTYRPGLNMELLAGIRLGHLGPSHFALEAGYLRHAVTFESQFRSPWGQGEKLEVSRIQQRWVFRLVIGF